MNTVREFFKNCVAFDKLPETMKGFKALPMDAKIKTVGLAILGLPLLLFGAVGAFQSATNYFLAKRHITVKTEHTKQQDVTKIFQQKVSGLEIKEKAQPRPADKDQQQVAQLREGLEHISEDDFINLYERVREAPEKLEETFKEWHKNRGLGHGQRANLSEKLQRMFLSVAIQEPEKPVLKRAEYNLEGKSIEEQEVFQCFRGCAVDQILIEELINLAKAGEDPAVLVSHLLTGLPADQRPTGEEQRELSQLLKGIQQAAAPKKIFVYSESLPEEEKVVLDFFAARAVDQEAVDDLIKDVKEKGKREVGGIQSAFLKACPRLSLNHKDKDDLQALLEKLAAAQNPLK